VEVGGAVEVEIEAVEEEEAVEEAVLLLLLLPPGKNPISDNGITKINLTPIHRQAMALMLANRIFLMKKGLLRLDKFNSYLQL